MSQTSEIRRKVLRVVEYCKTKVQMAALVGLGGLAALPPLIRVSTNVAAAPVVADLPRTFETLPYDHANSDRVPPNSRTKIDEPALVALPVTRANVGAIPSLIIKVPKTVARRKPADAQQAPVVPHNKMPLFADRQLAMRTSFKSASLTEVPTTRRRAEPVSLAARHPLPYPGDRRTRFNGVARPPSVIAEPSTSTAIDMPGVPTPTRKDEYSKLAGAVLPIERNSDAPVRTSFVGEDAPVQTAIAMPRIPSRAVPASETEAPAYIPWAERTSGHFKSGPVHGNPHMAPHLTEFSSAHKPGTIVVHVQEKRLYLIESASMARVYPIGTAHGALDILGRTRITTRRPRPSWTPTPNQRRRDPTLPRRVEPGPDNPLGMRALGLGWRYRLIHGTSDPSSIGLARSDGCIRMLNDDVTDLFDRVRVGNQVLVLASANAELVETRPPGYQEYKRRKKRWRKRRWSRKKYRSSRRYASRRKKNRRRRR